MIIHFFSFFAEKNRKSHAAADFAATDDDGDNAKNLSTFSSSSAITFELSGALSASDVWPDGVGGRGEKYGEGQGAIRIRCPQKPFQVCIKQTAFLCDQQKLSVSLAWIPPPPNANADIIGGGSPGEREGERGRLFTRLHAAPSLLLSFSVFYLSSFWNRPFIYDDDGTAQFEPVKLSEATRINPTPSTIQNVKQMIL